MSLAWRKAQYGDITANTRDYVYIIARHNEHGEQGYKVAAMQKTTGKFEDIGFAARLNSAKNMASNFEGEHMTAPKKNPVKAPARGKAAIAAKLKKAKALRAGFRYTAGGKAGQKSKVGVRNAPPVDPVQMIVGIIDTIEYTVLDEKGKRIKGQSFRHEFTGKSCPTLAVSSDGKQLYFVGGKYRFKTDGINDLK